MNGSEFNSNSSNAAQCNEPIAIPTNNKKYAHAVSFPSQAASSPAP
jgi:hypothetical protein